MQNQPQLQLKDDTYSIRVYSIEAPYVAEINFVDRSKASYITSLDSEGDPIVTKIYSEIPTVNGIPIFSSDKQLVEVDGEDLPNTNVSVEEGVWVLTGKLKNVSFIRLGEYIIDFREYKGTKKDIVKGTPYTILYTEYPFKDYIFIPRDNLATLGGFIPLSTTTITFGG